MLFYGLMQGGFALSAARTADDSWRLETAHGLKAICPRPDSNTQSDESFPTITLGTGTVVFVDFEVFGARTTLLAIGDLGNHDQARRAAAKNIYDTLATATTWPHALVTAEGKGRGRRGGAARANSFLRRFCVVCTVIDETSVRAMTSVYVSGVD